jgi:hypothetical protein
MTHKCAGAQKAASVSSRTMQGRKGRKHYSARAQRPRACEQGRKGRKHQQRKGAKAASGLS